MRSFIKSHRKTNSLDDSHAGLTGQHPNSEGLTTPDISKNDTLSFIQSTPPQSGSNFQGFKHSPGFEPFYKLNKKMFPGKLFKKNSSSNSPLLQPGPFGPKEYSSAPGTPQSNRYEIPGDIDMGRRNSHDNNRFLAVKGTVTHFWGDNGNDDQQVIILNDNNHNNSNNNSNTNGNTTCNNNSNNHGGKLQSSIHHPRTAVSSDLSPAVRIASMRNPPEKGPRNIQSSGYTPVSSTEERSLRQDEHQQPHIHSKLSEIKNKNRQARIHSHDDILHLGQNSSVTMDFLNSTFSPSALDEDSPDIHGHINNYNGKTTTDVSNISNISTTNGPGGMKQRVPTVKFKEDHNARQNSDVKAGYTGYLSLGKEVHEDYQEEEEEEEEYDDDDDAASKFSFEPNSINGRTSSVKYYSKPEPPGGMYIDDLYEDENFDEDMHWLEDDDGDMEFPSNHLDMSNNSDDESVVKKDIASSDAYRPEPKPVKKYKDLFTLSDEEEYDKNEDANYSELAGLGLDVGTINSSAQPFGSNEKRSLGSNSLSTGQLKNSESAERSQTNSPANFNVLRTSGSFDHDNSIRSQPPLRSPTNTVYSPVPSRTPSRTQSSPQTNVSAVRLQSPSAIKPTISHKSALNDEDLLNGQSPSNLQTSIPRNKEKALNLPKSKAVKSFSDIFDLDDSLSEENEGDLTKEANSMDEESSLVLDQESLEGSDDSRRRKYLQTHTSPLGRLQQTPIQIYLTPPDNSVYTPVLPSDSQLHHSITNPSLPPPARSQSLKYHDLSSNLDSDIPGVMSNLYFIDEAEEDKYMEEHKIADEEYLDEINTVPEDFNFSDSEQDGPMKSSLRRSLKGSFRATHSYSSQPTGTAKESAPAKNKLEIKNKTVTFFNHGWDQSPTDRYQISPRTSEQYQDSIDDYINLPSKADYGSFTPLTPNNSVRKPSPGFLYDKSLSPIQEGASSVDNSPRVPPSYGP